MTALAQIGESPDGRAALYRYTLPLVRPLPGSSGTLLREGLLVRLRDAGGREGWGDCAPLPGFSHEGLEDALGQLRNLVSLPPETWPESPLYPSVDFALGSARHWLAVAEGSQQQPAGPVRINALCTGGGEALGAAVDEAAEAGFTCVKIKVGGDPKRAGRTIAGLLRRYSGLRFRLDANRAWTLDEALTFARAQDPQNVDYMEEPLANWEEIPALAETAALPLALDESLAEAEARSWPGIRAWVLKPTLREGWRGALHRIAEARARGIQPVVSAAFESGIGLHSLAALALASGLDTVPAGLDTLRWLGKDLSDPPFRIADGQHHALQPPEFPSPVPA